MKRKIAGILTMIMVFGVVFLSLPIMQTASAETVYNCSNLTNIKIPVGVADIGLLNSGVGTPRSFSISALEADLPLLKVGFIAPLSDSYGQSARNGFDLALEQADYKAGGYSIEPIYQDDESDAAQAGSAANSLISQGVKAIVGSVNSNSTRPISAIADNHSVVLITGTASDPLVTVTNNERKSYVFRTCIIDAYESLAAADFVKNDLEKSTAAVLYSTDDSYYLPMASGFNNAFKSAGGQVLYYGSVSLESLDAKALSELSSLNPDVIYLACSDDQANTVASQILAAKNNPVFIGSSNWTWFGSLATDTFLNGSYFTSCYANDDPNQSNEAFKTAYKTKYRVEPDDTAALFYDAAKVLVNAINTSNSSDSTAIRDALQATTDFSGVSGDISYYTSSGNPCKQVVIQQVQNGGVKYITRKSGEGEDAIPPELTEVTAGTIEVGNDITATSNEDGYIYLVPADTNKTAAAVRAAGEGDNGRKAAVTLETEVIINTAGLEAGSYKVFAIDTLGNLSAGSDNINIYDSGTSETWVDWPETKQKSNTESLTITFNKAVDFTTANKTNIF
ncbi:MAG: ABC transporter substrate-binding protein, partial [Syntrophomonas sp.]